MSKVRKEGRSQSPLTRIATEHNWSKLQIKGATGHMLNVLAKHGYCPATETITLVSRIRTLEKELTALVEESYGRRKEDYAKRRKELVDKYGEDLA